MSKRKTTTTIAAAVRIACGINLDKGSHGRAFTAVPGREPRAFRAGSKRAAAMTLALRECGVSDIEAAAAFIGRAPRHSRERMRAHVELCEAQLALAGYAGAWLRVYLRDYLAAVELTAGRDAARKARAMLSALPLDATIWTFHAFPAVTDTAALERAIAARLEAIAAAGRKAAAPKAKAKRKAAGKRKAARK